MDQILQKCENAIFEGDSQLLQAYIQNKDIYYLVRSETNLRQCAFRQNMTIITKLCDNNCTLDKQLTNMHDFLDIETMHKQLELEQVCSYKYFQANQKLFKVGTHNDILDNMYYNKYNNATLIFEDAHDLPLKLEKAMSSILSTQFINSIVKTYLQKNNEKSNWDQLMNQKLKLLSKTFNSINQNQYNILMPLISFAINVVQHFQNEQKNEFIIESNKIGTLLSECTTNITQQAFIVYMKNFGIQTQNCVCKYYNLNQQNYEEYLNELLQIPQRHLFTQWYILIKQGFEMQDSAEIELINFQTCQSVERVSLDRSIQSPEQQNYKDYKLIIHVDCIQNIFNCSLICLNPLVGILKLQNNGMKQLVLISNHTHPQKLYKTELNIEFTYYPQIPIKELKLNSMIATKVQNSIIDYLNKNEQTINQMIIEIGKQLQLLNFQLNDHGLLTLFSSKSFMQKCQDLWSQHSILSALGVNKEFQWLKYQNKKSVYETMRLFLNKCRFNTIIGDTMPAIYTLFNDMFLDQLQDAIENLHYQQRKNTQTLKNSQQITVILIGVPWASQSMYNVDYVNEQIPSVWLNQKLEWLKNQKTQFDRKHFSTVQAIRNISRLQYILNKLNPCNLIVLDEKFEQKTLWKQESMPPIMTFQDITKELIKITPAMVRSDNMTQNKIEMTQQQQKKPTQNIKILIKQPIETSKRKIMLNKVLLSDMYNPQKKSMPVVQSEKITLEELIGSEKKRETQSDTDEQKCVICWSNTQETPMCKSEKCGHVACTGCWKEWLSNKLECPLCRTRVREKFLIPI